MEMLATHEFWIGLLKIIGVNIVLSGDNAVVIALAARSLPPKQQKAAIFWGAGAAIILRIILTIFAVQLLSYPWLKLVGALLLLWIGISLLLPEDGDQNIDSHENLMAAIRTILIADLVMSLDNVIAVAAAAAGNIVLLVLGLAISIPLVIFGSTLLVKLMERFPIIITIGAGLLGFVAGEMLVTDPAIQTWLAEHFTMKDGRATMGGMSLEIIAGIIGAIIVIAAGTMWAKKKTEAAANHGAAKGSS
jgi:YjbE family integral membrane protein